MELSVVVTNYNKSKWLPSLLEELKKQKRDEVEYIIIDDCSTDNTYEIAETYQAQHPEKIKLIKNKKWAVVHHVQIIVNIHLQY